MQTVRLNKSTLRALAQMDLTELFREIYRNNYWGSDKHHVFYSGSGSHDEKLIRPYIDEVRKFLSSFATPPVVIDLGCGDFNIGRQLADLSSMYHGCDIVEQLIEYNLGKFGQDRIRFSCLDATTQILPPGDVLIVRQVLQHLSNAAIQKVVKQFTDFAHVILTEHIPQGGFVANLDKPSGPDSRLRV